MSEAKRRQSFKEADGGRRLYTIETHDLGEGSAEFLVRSGDPAVIANARNLFELLEGRLAEQSLEDLTRLVQVIPLELPEGYTASELALAKHNAEARQRFLEEHRVLDATEVHTLSGLRAKNEHATANRWREQGRIFAVSVQRQYYYPAFQFEHGEPKPIFRRLIAAGAPHYRGWPLALWLQAPSGWLAQNARPIDVIDRDPKVVVAALDNETTAIG